MPVNSGSQFSGKVVLISGATGAVGSALCTRLLDLGARLGIAVRRESQVGSVADPNRGRDMLVGVVGSRDGEAAAGLIKGVEDSLGPIAHFISTAGMYRYALVGDERGQDAGALIEANYLSVVNLVRAVVGPMKRRRAGSIVLTGAQAVGEPNTGMSLYLASKAALHEYASVLRAECAQHGIGVAVVKPGILDTEANRNAMPDVDRSSWTPVDRLVETLLEAAQSPLQG